MSDVLPVKPAKNSFGRAMLAVAWSFLGIRKKSGFEEDLARFHPCMCSWWACCLVCCL